MCVSKLTSIGPDNGLAPMTRQAIIWTDAGILFIEPLGTHFSKISIEIHIFSFKKTPSHYHHCANFIWRHWTYEMPVRYNLSSVRVTSSIFSQLSIIQYVGLCVFSLPISFVMIERIYILCLIIIIKSEVWTITHCLGLGHETMVYAVCRSIFSLKMSSVKYQSFCLGLNVLMAWRQRQINSDIFRLAAYIEVCELGVFSHDHHKFNDVDLYYICIFKGYAA